MDTLPNELMVEILQNLTQSDLDNSVDVCDHWKDLIYDGIGVQRCIGGILPGYPFFGKSKLPILVDFKEIGETGMNDCFIGDICDDEELSNYRNVYLIKKMSFVGSIGENTFKTLTNPLNNLSCLSFELKTLNNFQFSSGLHFPNLKQFRLSDLISNYPKDDDNLWMNFLRIYLESYFPKLQILHLISIPLLTVDDGKILVDALIVFLDKHKKTLQKFGLLAAFNLIEVGNEIPEIPQVQMTNQLQLQNFQFASSHINSLVRQELNGILKTQTNLKAYMDVLAPIDPNLIQQNSSTLVTIDLFLFIGSDRDYLIDFDVFKNCTALKYFTLCGYGRITNTKCLPPSLESIRIMNFQMDSKDASDLMTMKWTHLLKSLELRNIGKDETFGVPFDAICTLLKQKTVARILIYLGMNKTSFDDAKQLTLTNATNLPGLARRILERIDNNEIQFGLDIDKNYVFMEWSQLQRKLYIPEESNQIYVDGMERGPCRMNSMIF